MTNGAQHFNAPEHLGQSLHNMQKQFAFTSFLLFPKLIIFPGVGELFDTTNIVDSVHHFTELSPCVSSAMGSAYLNRLCPLHRSYCSKSFR